MSTFKKAITTGAAALGLTAGMLAMAAPAQADTHAEWFNNRTVCERATDNRVAHYRASGYTVSVQNYCKGEQYIGYMPQYYSEIHYN
ncbi:MAG: hypothetical protein ACTHZ5_01935 [Micrococcaceae bacterium]